MTNQAHLYNGDISKVNPDAIVYSNAGPRTPAWLWCKNLQKALQIVIRVATPEEEAFTAIADCQTLTQARAWMVTSKTPVFEQAYERFKEIAQ